MRTRNLAGNAVARLIHFLCIRQSIMFVVNRLNEWINDVLTTLILTHDFNLMALREYDFQQENCSKNVQIYVQSGP